ncbi:hypothetical protein P154DRAFT_584851 [Amniculicola lignicola CBS 123094]|uniref:Uncharacterized protein n=1 Tax=Amniculicola lignicola CBS 123094 TaxID=1392246 RepID=A0A6A5X5Q1_9PLEO|nr:hypothetical protein P154DRAFT_584851 [Amniculicola lignicola CBS 123094]
MPITSSSDSGRPSPKAFTGWRDGQQFTTSPFMKPSQVGQAPSHSRPQFSYCTPQLNSSYCIPFCNNASTGCSSSPRSSISNVSPTAVIPPSHRRPQLSTSNSDPVMASTNSLQKRRKGSVSSLSLFKLPLRFSFSKSKPRQPSTKFPTAQRRESTNSSISVPASTSTCSLPLSPPISPTTTISPEPHRPTSGKPSLHISTGKSQEEHKYGFPFGHPILQESTRGRNLGSVSSSIPPTSQVFNAHPGTLVAFSPPLPTTTSEVDINIDACSPAYFSSSESNNTPSSSSSYHAYLRSTARSKSTSTTTTTTSKTTNSNIRHSTRPSRHQNICYQAAKLERRARSLSAREQQLREGTSTSAISPSTSPSPSPTTSSSPIASNSFPPPMPISQPKPPAYEQRSRNPSTVSHNSATSNTSCISVEEFLSRVRTSFDQRRSRSQEGTGRMGAEYDIFVDEVERGFIGDEPL